MKESIWAAALNELVFSVEEPEKIKIDYKAAHMRKSMISALCITVAAIIAVAGLVYQKQFFSPKMNPSPEQTVSSAPDLAINTTASSDEPPVTGGNKQITLTEGKYRVVRYEIPESYEIADLYLKTYPANDYVELACTSVVKSRLEDEKSLKGAAGAWFFRVGEENKSIEGLCLIVPQLSKDAEKEGIRQIYYFAKTTDEDGKERLHTDSFSSFKEGEDQYIILLEALSSKTSPDSPAMLVEGKGSRYVVIGDIAYYTDLCPDYLGFLPDFLEENEIEEDELETVVIKIN